MSHITCTFRRTQEGSVSLHENSKHSIRPSLRVKWSMTSDKYISGISLLLALPKVITLRSVQRNRK